MWFAFPFCRLQFGEVCTIWAIMDPTVQAVTWVPLFVLIAVICVSVYVRIGLLARRARREIRSQEISVLGQQADHRSAGADRSQRRTTLSLLLVSVVFLSTNAGETLSARVAERREEEKERER